MKKTILLLIAISIQTAFAQWEPLNFGMYGGTVNALLTVNADMLAGTRGGVFRSANLGGKWTPTDLQGVEISKFLNTGVRILAAADNGLYISTNSGVNWTRSDALPYKLTSFAIGGGYVYAGTEGEGVFRSSDNGASWTQINAGISDKNISSLFVFGQNVFAGACTDFYLSSNNGNVWQRMDLGTENYLCINDIVTLEGRIYAGTYDGIIVSSDNGASWTPKAIGAPNVIVHALSARGSELYAGTSAGFYYSTDRGESWVHKSEEIESEDALDVEFNGSIIFLGVRDRGIFGSGDFGETWFETNNGLSAVPVNSLAINGNAIIAATDGLGAFGSQDLGSNWTQSGLDSGRITSALIHKGKFFIGDQQNGVMSSSDQGATWEKMSEGISDVRVNALASNGQYLFAGSDAVYYSPNEGLAWERSPVAFKTEFIAAKGEYIFAGNSDLGLLRSTDLGATWEEKSSGKSINDTVTSIDFGENLTFAASTGGLYISADHGNFWTLQNGDLTNPYVNIVKTRDDFVFIGTESGLYRSNDDGLHWKNLTFNLPAKNISTIEFDNYYAYVGTKNNGVFRAPINSVTSAQDEPGAAPDITLYPNPASEFVTLRLKDKGEHGGYAQVIDLLGVVALNVKVRGSMEQRIDVSSLPAGAYFVRFNGASAMFIKH